MKDPFRPFTRLNHFEKLTFVKRNLAFCDK